MYIYRSVFFLHIELPGAAARRGLGHQVATDALVAPSLELSRVE